MLASNSLPPRLVDSYKSEIELLIKQAHYVDALEMLMDFARDFAPESRTDAIMLYSRYSNNEKRRRRGLSPSEPLDAIVYDILELTALIAKGVSISAPLGILQLSDNKSAPIMPLTNAVDRAEDDYFSLNKLRKIYIDNLQQYQQENQILVFDANNISKVYKRNAKSFTLNPINIKLFAGEIAGVVGLNGSGKTTLLRLLSGEIAPDSGRLTYPALSTNQKDWGKIRSQIAYVRQPPNRWSGKLRYNLNYIAAAYGTFGTENRDLVDTYILRYGLKPFENATWDQISGGYKIRFELVRALLVRHLFRRRH